MNTEKENSETNKHKLVLGIRREDKNRWERRAPLAPQHVKELVSRGIKVIVQPSSLRTFSDRQYEEAGGVIQEDLSEAPTVLAVKEVPIDLLMPEKTYLFFSHTIKAQPTNMRMLDNILDKRIRLIDYEGIVDDSGKRLVRFGKFAGYAGTIDTLHALGDRLLALGHSTPFLHLGYSYCYSSLKAAKEAVAAMGEEISHYGLPQDLVPFTFVITSQGNVSQGAQDIMKLLPHKLVTPNEMAELVKNKDKASPFMIYVSVVTVEDYIEPIDPKAKFDKDNYYTHPEKYKSVFYEKIAPYVSVIINCGFWNARYPRFFTMNQIQELVEQNRNRLLAVGDISCDTMGSIEFLVKTTSIDSPLFIYNPITREVHDSTTDQDFIYEPGVLFCAVDNFPTEFPKEATQWFGDHLLPFVDKIARSDPSKPFAEQQDLPHEIYRAVIACHGELTPKYKYITDLRKESEKSYRSILLLGAGFVSGSAVDYLSRNPNVHITIADIVLSQAEALASSHPNCTAVTLDVKNPKSLEMLVSQNNVVISLLPVIFHQIVADACLKHKKHLVTASYTSEVMKKMNEEVTKAGLTFLNEIGLDPGVDHLEALRVIESVKEQGGKIRSFVSWCGGLPMPESSQNPMGYKFSWSPRGVLSAATKDAKYLQDGKLVEIPGHSLFKHKQQLNIFPGFNLEGIPNRDATIYANDYGISGEVRTMFRGTLRFPAFCDVMQAVVELGLLDDKPQPFLSPDAPPITWSELLRKLIDVPEGVSTKIALKQRLRAHQGFPFKGFTDDQIRKVSECFKWLGMFSDKLVDKKGTYIDTFCEILQQNMQYEKDEQDMILLHHIFGIEWPNGTKETRTSTLVVHGTKKGKAMNRSVGLPVAIAAELLMKGTITQRGVIVPTSKEIYVPILKALAGEGLKFVEKSKISLKSSQP